MNIWIIMIILGLLTFATRLSFIALLERINLPRNFQRALRFVPIAVLSAIIAPELAYSNNQLAISITNPRLLAGLIATLVAYRTKNVILTIIIGMSAFWLLKIWL
ncbi:MAG: AzlD domain-containing protein [Chloroflexi bacterium]|nr:AzlD domain-containing protein [Chloroflexota bacterium]